MKRRVVGSALALLGVAAAFFLALTFPPFHREITAAKARLNDGSTVLKTGHGDIEYATEGEGPPVLALHGAGGGYDQGLWAARIAFGSAHKLISVSRYGYLRTPLPHNASLKSQAAQYRDLLDELHIDRVIVLGTSAGGPSATQFAADFPARTAALILLSAVSEASVPGDKPPFYIGIIHLIQQSDYAYWLVARFMQPVILNLMGIPAGVYAAFDPAQKQLAQEMLATMHPMSQRYRGTVNDGVLIGRDSIPSDRVSAPTLILHAKDDALVSYHHALHAHESIRGSQLAGFETGGHGLLPRINAVRRSVSEFLARP
jgi:pimeloyl-ACP methyl ester carboxylesterase